MPLPICHEPEYKDQLDKFLRDWPISRVRTMPLTDYSRINNDTDESFRGSFCYALEHETPLGIERDYVTGSGTNNGVRPQCCSLTPLLGSDPVEGHSLRGRVT